MSDQDPNRYATEEQQVYAVWLDRGMKIGFVMLVASFVAYLLGLFEPHVPVSRLPEMWRLSASEYRAAADVGTGWSWLGLAHKGDFMNFVGIAFLSAITIACYIRVIPLFLKSGDKVYAGITAVTALVLILAASGLLVVGH
jgi:hypothetical protein